MLRAMRFASVRRLSAAAAVFCVCSVAFAEEPSPGPDDVAYTVVGTEKTYYQTLDLLFAKITNDTKVVVFKDCPFSSAVSFTNAVEFSSESPGGSIIELSAGAGFQILENSSLKVRDLRFARAGQGAAPFVISGGELEFGRNAKISGLAMSGAGNAVRVDRGVFRMLEGSSIEDCTATTGCFGSGGAVYLGGAESRFEFYGGTISNCSSRNYGGAAYAARGASVALKGSPSTVGNKAKSISAAADVYFVGTAAPSDAPLLSVEDGFAGSVGVYYSGRMGASDRFASVAGAAVASAVCSRFSNAVDGSLRAVPSADATALVWAEAAGEDATAGPLPDSNGAEAKVVNGSAVKYYAKVVDALEIASDGERVELLKDAALDDSVEISSKIVFDGCGFTLSRGGKFLIDVGDSALSVTNIVLDGADHPGRFLNVRNGSLVFESGTTLRNVNGSTSDFVAPVVVWGGTFTMNGGRIEKCVNGYVPEPGGPLTAGAVVVSDGKAYFNGGVVTECVGSRAGGVCVYNGSTAYVKGGFTVLTNATPAGAVCNLVIQDLSKMIVVDDVVGKIGCYDGYLADTNIASHVDASFASSATPSNLVASALRFRHDVLDVKAVPVRNGDETLFVWRTALGDDGKFTTKIDGVEKVYDEIVFPLEDPDFVPCPPFAFTAIKEAGDKTRWIMTIKPAEEYCKYTFYASDDLKNWERVHETGALAPGTVTADGGYVFESPAVGDKRFWRAEGRDGLK